MTSKLLDSARRALEQVNESPATALDTATGLLDKATDHETLATAHYACGMAHRVLADGGQSTDHLERAARYADNHPDLHGKVLRSLAFNYAQAGNHRLADSTILRSIELLDGAEADISRLQQAFILLMRGEHRTALPVLDTAVANFEKQGAEVNLELTLHNRALVHMEFGDYDASIADLERAYEIGIRLKRNAAAATAAAHLSQVLGWHDDIPAAMRWHARSVELSELAGAANPVADMEHAYVLIQARLMREAEAMLLAAIPKLEEAGDNDAILVSGRLLLIDVLMEKGDHQAALHQVEKAAAETPADGRWRFDVAAARHKIRIAAGEENEGLLAEMTATADQMAANGESHAAVEERCRAIEVALAIGDVVTARQLAEDIRPFTRSGPLWLQVRAWTAQAQLRMELDDRRGAAAALRAGMNRLDAYRTGIGSADLQIHAAAHGEKLAGLGVRAAIASGKVDRIFGWTERLRFRPGRATSSGRDELNTRLISLRRATVAARRASDEVRPEALRNVARLEREIRQLSRQMEGIATGPDLADLATVRSQLNEQTLIEYIEDRNIIFALVVDGRRTRFEEVCESTEITRLIDHLRFSAERIARPSTSSASRLAAIASVQELIARLRGHLVSPLQLNPGRVVVVPTGALFGIPWAMMFDAPVIAAPSASAWLRAAGESQPPGRTLVVAGPGLEHAREEAEEIAALTGGSVTTSIEETIQLLPETSAVHFACHARPRTDSPLFSSLILEDGELNLYDIERLRRVPERIVLAACSGAGSVLASGDEVLSLAGSFLDMGARTVVAPLFTISDELTRSVMASVHGETAAGVDFPSAIFAAATVDDPETAFTAGSFTCFGAV